jgi:uncharacterized protein (TIGR03085 family)
MTPARRERHRLADELLAVGPDAPTLCAGWTARDLAAHIVVRDRRPDSAPGLIVKAAAGHTERVRRGEAGNEYGEILARLRSGPPIWSPVRLDPVDRMVNTIEFFVHLEDVRRAQPDWQPRQLDDDLASDLYAALRRGAKMLVRKAPTGVTLAPDGGRAPIVAKPAGDGAPMVTVSGPIGELVLFAYGRQAHATVGLVGPDDAVEAIRTAGFGS